MLGQIDLLVNSFVRGVDALERIAGALEKTAEIQDRTIMNFSEALTHNSHTTLTPMPRNLSAPAWPRSRSLANPALNSRPPPRKMPSATGPPKRR